MSDSINTNVRDFGIKLVIVDNGFAYIGRTVLEGGYYIISSAANVRKAGTTRGFGQIAFDGPTKETELDRCPPVLVPAGRVCHLMEVAEDKWTKVLA